MKRNIYIYIFIIVCFALCLSSCGDDSVTISIDCNNKQKNNKQKKDSKVCLNIYLENSASMDGYVDDYISDSNSSLSTILYGFISNLKSDTTRLNYINSQIINFPKDLDGFIKNISKQEFQKAGGKRNSTNISAVIDSIIGKSNKNTVDILISDFIADEGFKDAQLQIKIENILKKKIEKDNTFSAIVFRVLGNFNGKCYYYKNNYEILQNKMRPYYIIVMGNANNIAKLLDANKFSNILKYTDKFVYTKSITPEYKIFDNMEVDSKKYPIRKNTSLVMNIRTNLSNLFYDDEYIKDINNYSLSNGITIARIDTVGNKYNIKVEIDNKERVCINTFSIKLKQAKPKIKELSTTETVWKPDTQYKTYGLEYILNGFNECFNNEYIFELKFKVKK